MKHINNITIIVLALGLLILNVGTNTGAFAAAPVISNERVQLRTLANGDIVVNVSATIEDLDGIGALRVTVARPGAFGPFPMQPGLYLSPGDSLTLDGFGVTIGPEFIPAAQRAGDYVITVDDGGGAVSTTASLPNGLVPLPAGAKIDEITVDASTGLLRPTISIPAIPGATSYRISIQNDSDSTSTTFDGVAGANLSPTPSIRVGANILEAGKFYRFNIDAFDASQVALSDRRSESADICYDPTTGKTDIPCIPQKDVHLITESDGRFVMQAIGRVLHAKDLEYLKNPPPTDPPIIPVTVTRGAFGPFPLTASILRDVDIDSSVTDRFTSARNPLDATQIPVEQRAGNYTFTARDSDADIVSVTRNFPTGLAPLPPTGPVTIDPISGQFTPTVSIVPVPGASNYRVVVFNDSDSTRKNFDNLPGGTLAERPFVKIFPDVIQPSKLYRIHMEAYNGQTFSSSTLRSRSNSLVYDPSGLDSDGDGIQDTIDLSASFSDDFSNVGRGGNISGTIINRADLDVVVVEPPETGKNGLRIGAAGGGSGTAQVNACIGTVIHLLTERDAEEIKPCSSLNVAVLDGIIEYQLGNQGFVVAPAGARVTIDEPSPGQYTVKNSEESFVPITLLKDGEKIPVQPGAAGVSIPIVDIKPGDGPNCVNPKSQGLVPVAILGGAVNVKTIVQSSLEIDDDASATTAGVKAAMTAIKDINGDGVNDLIMQFKTQNLSAAGLLSDGRTLYLTARLTDGAQLIGSDVVYLSGGPTCR